MNRCITCLKIVTKRKAQSQVQRVDHTYLVCCPLCEEEFNRDPEHYLAVARSVLGHYALKAHSQASPKQSGFPEPGNPPLQDPNILKNLQGGFAEIEQSFSILRQHFDEVSESGGLGRLRNALGEHKDMILRLQNMMTVHAGVCRFVVSVAESARAVSS